MKAKEWTDEERDAAPRQPGGLLRVSMDTAFSRPAVQIRRLSAGERGELAQLLGIATRRCDLCGSAGHDIARLSDDQKRRTLALLRVVLGRDDRETVP